MSTNQEMVHCILYQIQFLKTTFVPDIAAEITPNSLNNHLFKIKKKRNQKQNNSSVKCTFIEFLYMQFIFIQYTCLSCYFEFVRVSA